jgi:hypothetical protein
MTSPDLFSNPEYDRRMGAVTTTAAFKREPIPVQMRFRREIIAYPTFEETPPEWQKFILRMEE